MLTTTISWIENRNQSNDVGPSGIALHVGGLTDTGSDVDEFVEWVRRRLSTSDTISVRIVEAAETDEPLERRHRDSKQQE